MIAVKWWKLVEGEGDERTYEGWDPSPEDIEKYGMQTSNGVCFLLNATELRHVDFQMDAAVPLPIAPTGARTRGRARTESERVATTGRRYVLPADVENQILALCWSTGQQARPLPPAPEV